MLRVHIETPSPRSRYVIEHVVKVMLGWEMEFVRTVEEFRSATGPKLYYGRRTAEFPDCHTIPSSGWLEQEGHSQFEPPIAMQGGLPVFFPSAHGSDLFAGIFHLLSRYEEYAAPELDQHGRLASDKHFVVRHGIEKVPIIDQLVLQTAHQWRARSPELPPPARRYTHTVTVDVDNGSKYLGRPFWKQGGAAVRDLVKGEYSLAAERIAVLRGTRNDPFEIHQRVLEAAASNKVDRLIAFILVRGGKRFDHAADTAHPTVTNAIKQFAANAEVGIHPSYDSSTNEELIPLEQQELARITGTAIGVSRQHFLRWSMPDTLRALEAAGIREDHSIGFSDRSGFRAGTCTPYRWYDLLQDRATDLVLHPFCIMDSALHDRSGLRPKEAIEEFLRISDEVRNVQGSFISVWHDRFLSGHGQWVGWPEAFRQVIEKAAP